MRKRLGSKILVMILVLALIFVINAAVSFLSFSNIERSGKRISEEYVELVAEFGTVAQCVERSQKYMNILAAVPPDVMLQSGADESVYEGIHRGIDDDYAIIRSAMEEMNRHVTVIGDEELIAKYAAYQTYMEAVYEKIRMIRDLTDAFEFGQANMLLGTEVTPFILGGQSITEDLQNTISQGIDKSAASYEASITRARLISWIALGIYALGVVLIVIVVNRVIAKPAKEANKQLNSIMEDIHNNKGDLTERIRVKSEDEIGTLAGGINEFLEQLQKIMTKIRDDSENMQVSVNLINERLGQSSDDVNGVSAVMDQLSASMEEITATLTELNTSAEEIIGHVDAMNARTDEGTELVSEIKDRANDIRRLTDESKKNIVIMIESKKGALNEAIEESHQVEKIRGLTEDILEISGQTNLLALNASIEAARAGEAGRGFAVVAEEIGALASDSRQAANNIQDISGNIVNAVKRLADSAEEIIEFLNETVLPDYDNFARATDTYHADAENVDSFFADFRDRAKELQSIMSSMGEGLSGITEALDESARGVTEAAANTGDLVTEITSIHGEAEKNMMISDSLHDEVERFKNM